MGRPFVETLVLELLRSDGAVLIFNPQGFVNGLIRGIILFGELGVEAGE